MTTLLIVLVCLAGAWLLLVAVLALAGRGPATREIASFLPNLLLLFRGLAGDPRVPRRTKVLLGAAAVWIASPIDLMPEFIPVVGSLDDAIVAALVLRRVLRVAGPEVAKDHWRGDSATLERLLRFAGTRSAAS